MTKATVSLLTLADAGRRTMLTVFKLRVFANAITHRPTPELAAFCTTHSPGFKVTYSLSNSAAVGGLMASIANCCGSASGGRVRRVDSRPRCSSRLTRTGMWRMRLRPNRARRLATNSVWVDAILVADRWLTSATHADNSRTLSSISCAAKSPKNWGSFRNSVTDNFQPKEFSGFDVNGVYLQPTLQ